MSNYARMLIDLLGKPDAKTPLRPDQIRYAWTPGAESLTGAKHMAQLLFMVIREHHGDRIARRIFAMWATPPTPARLQQIANAGLLDAYDRMRPTPNVQRLARERAERNKTLPPSERRGAGSVDPIALEKHIRRQIKSREKAMKAGTWRGPFPMDKQEREE
jgi:hypothetical protein